MTPDQTIRFQAFLCSDEAVFGDDELPDFKCPVTRPLRALGHPTLKAAVRALCPSPRHVPLHVSQASEVLGDGEIEGLVTVEVRVLVLDETSLQIAAEFQNDKGEWLSRSHSVIKFVALDEGKKPLLDDER